jgi:AbrB family looped-hinge helix DNA binding protein
MNLQTTLIIDKSGRLVIPKPVRDALGLRPGDRLELRRQGADLILSVSQPKSILQKEKGVWVYRSGERAAVPIQELIDQDRARRAAEAR